MKFFSIDSPLYRFMQRLTDVIVLNILWLVFSLPIVTIGCSTAAAFSVTMKFLDESERFYIGFQGKLEAGTSSRTYFYSSGSSGVS